MSPAPVRIEDTTRLRYELHVTNFAGEALTLTRVQALDAATGAVLGDFEGAELRERLGSAGAASRPEVIEPGTRSVVYLSFPVGKHRPSALIHRVAFGAPGDEAATVEGGMIELDLRPLPILGPPLRGGPWVAVYDPAMERGHRRVIYAVDGRARIPGRYAIDWMKPRISPEGGGPPASGYGADVLAVANAAVVATRDGIAEPPLGDGGSPVSLDAAAGNYIVLDLGDGRYAFYEHLKPGLLVKPGDRVTKGQVIAALGFTGQATRPHLHFHVGDARSPLPAEGLPYLLSDFRVLGTYDSIGAFSRGESWSPSAASEPRRSFPAPNVVVRFPDG